MKKLSLLLMFLVVLGFLTPVMVQGIYWIKEFKGKAFAVAIAPNEDIIVAGYTESFGAGSYDFWVLRLDENGNVKWQKTYGGSGWDKAFAVAVTPDGDGVLGGDYVIKFNVDDAPLYEGDGWGDSNAIVKDSSAVVKHSSAKVGTSKAIVKNTNAKVTDVDDEGELLWTYTPGILRVSSTPSGARVYIDGKYKGETPLELKLKPGVYTVRVSKKGYEDYETRVGVKPGKVSEVNAVLKPYGILKVSSTPSGAKVYIDGEYRGKTPLELKLEPGVYTVKVSKKGYEDYETRVEIKTGKTVDVSVSLSMQTQSSGKSTMSTSITDKAETVGSVTLGAGFMGNFGRGLLVLVGLLLLIALAKARKSSETSKRPTKTPPKDLRKPEELKAFPKELLPKYEPLEFLGEGGFAKVFKVKRKSDGKIIALKIPRIDERTSKTFIKEVSTWLHLNHPNIVRLYDVDILPVPYLEMEYVEGVKVGGKTIRDLDKYPKPVDEGTALKLIKGIAEGLRYAHEKGVYHRDLKPLNILLKSDLTPKITDWGLAKVGTMSSSRSVLGYTPLYAAPEHLMPGKYGHTDARTDIWQLGVTFYELLTGKLPFEGYTYEEVFGKIVDESYKFTPPSKINPQLAKYDGIFEKLLAKRKEERYQSVDDFLRDLKELEAEKRKAELEREVEELKKSLKRSVEALKRSKSAKEALKNRRLVVETLGKLALAYAQLNRKAELLNTLNDLKFYTVQNLTDLTNAISTVEMMIKENVPVGDDFMERLKVLVHNIKRENEV